MNSVGEDLMLVVKARLTAPQLGWASGFRRTHRTAVMRDQAPMVHLVDGADLPVNPRDGGCTTARRKSFTVSVFERDDDGASVADLLVLEINGRLDPSSTAYAGYPHGAVLLQGAITPNEETADADASRIDMEFTFEYSTEGWSLQ